MGVLKDFRPATADSLVARVNLGVLHSDSASATERAKQRFDAEGPLPHPPPLR